jgi:hypothetical protein
MTRMMPYADRRAHRTWRPDCADCTRSRPLTAPATGVRWWPLCLTPCRPSRQGPRGAPRVYPFLVPSQRHRSPTNQPFVSCLPSEDTPKGNIALSGGTLPTRRSIGAGSNHVCSLRPPWHVPCHDPSAIHSPPLPERTFAASRADTADSSNDFYFDDRGENQRHLPGGGRRLRRRDRHLHSESRRDAAAWVGTLVDSHGQRRRRGTLEFRDGLYGALGLGRQG